MTQANPETQPLTLSSVASASVSRRRFLTGTTVAAGVAFVAAACGNSDSTDTGASQTTTPTAPTTTAGANADLDVAATAAGLEKLAADTYTAAGQLAAAGKLGASVPPAVATFVSTAAKQHQEALDAWNRVLTSNGRSAVTTPNAQIKPVVDAAAAKLTDVPGAASLALRLEDYASQTYQKVIPTLKSADAIKLAGQINIVGQQHQAILRYVLGLYPVGSGLAKEPKDFAPSDPQVDLLTK